MRATLEHSRPDIQTRRPAEPTRPGSSRATTIVVATFGVLAGLAGVEHGIGEILQGRGSPEALVIESWPDAKAMEILQGEPALTVIPDVMLAGILTVLVAIAVGIWSVSFAGGNRRGVGLLVLSALLLVVGGGFGPPLVGMVLGIWAMRGAESRAPGRVRRALAPAWPWLAVAGAVGYLSLMPGMVVLAKLGIENAGLVLAASVLAFAGLLGALVAARSHDQLEPVTPADTDVMIRPTWR
jgi:hypothetical protein